MAAKLGQILIASGVITEEQLNEALSVQKKKGGRLGANLVKLGHVTEEQLVTFLSKQYGVSAINLADYKIDPAVLKLIPSEMAKKHMIMPVARVGATLTVAMADPFNVFAVDDIKFMTGYNVEVVIAPESALMDAIATSYGGRGVVAAKPQQQQQQQTQASTVATAAEILQAKDYTVGEDGNIEDMLGADEGPTVDVEEFDAVVGKAIGDVEVVEEKEDAEVIREVAAPIIKLTNGILLNAIKAGASDIQIEPYENSVRVRYRIDGECRVIMNLPAKIKAALTSRIKIMARLDISEKRLPQDGRIKLKLGKKKEVDFRVSTVPCLFGERTNMRILDKANLQVDLTRLGIEEEPLKDLMAALEKPNGMILVTGPTGCGKTTTLYSALNYLNKIGVNVSTAEDPVEYNFPGINQVAVKEDIGLTFAAALRSFLRQDPDIIMVGEIRDFETAEISVKAALTGHLVLSTLHTNDAPGTISRLLNMGIEPFLVAASVILIASQRLVRKICPQCKEEEKIPVPALIKLGFPEEEAASIKCLRGKGCPACNNAGYRGRIGLYEIMPMKDEIKELTLEGASSDEIKKAAVRLGMRTLRMSGLVKIKDGTTSVEEIVRATFGD
ncbi:MAG: type IV-A pilus assembly ATPase PilB [Nitrospirae bacterium]|nr:MAG: type IV-A pilus assembly ATPase PilB [Nitrospirota bacterium]